MNKKNTRNYFLPLILACAIIVLDQLTKYLVIRFINPWSIGASFFGDLIRIVCVYNTGAAFSLGSGLSTLLRFIIMVCLPACFIAAICIVYFKSAFTRLERWCLSGIIGGGISNLLDRFFRAEGVVDFIDIKFFGLLGLERWPTFNIADTALVLCSLGLCAAIFFDKSKHKICTEKTSRK